MPIFIVITTLFLSLLGYGEYVKTTYVDTPPTTDIGITADMPPMTPPITPMPPDSTPIPTTTLALSPEPIITPPTPIAKPVAKPKSKPISVVNSDHSAPSELAGLEASYDDGIVSLSWFASDDNVGVKGYRIYRDKKLIGTTIETFYAEANVSVATVHTYTVYAYDNAGNVSSGLSISPADEEAPSNAPIAVVATPTPPQTTATPPTPTPTPIPASEPTPPSAPTPVPTVSVIASPSSIAYNTRADISWTSTNASSCSSANGGGSGTSGSFSTPILTANTTYSVTCTGVGGVKTGSASVSVAAAPAPTPPPTASCGNGGTCTGADIASHNSRGDCWVYLSPLNKAYNITAYVANGNKHPGGDVIVPFCGTNMYNYFIGSAGGHRHSSSALNSVLQAYYIGVFQP